MSSSFGDQDTLRRMILTFRVTELQMLLGKPVQNLSEL